MKELVLGMYVPNVVFAAWAMYLILRVLLLPALQHKTFRMTVFAIAVSAFFSLLAHAGENTVYGLIRWTDWAKGLNTVWWLIGALKLCILTASYYAVLALTDPGDEETEQQRKARSWRLAGIIVGLWAIGTLIAVIVH